MQNNNIHGMHSNGHKDPQKIRTCLFVEISRLCILWQLLWLLLKDAYFLQPLERLYFNLCVPMYLLCLLSDFHSFNYHNFGHLTSLAFQLFWVSHYCTVFAVYLFIYNYFLVNSSSCLQQYKINCCTLKLKYSPSKG